MNYGNGSNSSKQGTRGNDYKRDANPRKRGNTFSSGSAGTRGNPYKPTPTKGAGDGSKPSPSKKDKGIQKGS